MYHVDARESTPNHSSVSHVCLTQSRKYPSKTVQDCARCGIMFYINVLRDYDKRTIVDTSNNLENNVSPANQDPRSDAQQEFEYAESFEQEAHPADDAELHATGAQHFSSSEISEHASEDAAKQPYVRQHRHHKTVEPISDFTMPGEKLEIPENQAAGFESSKGAYAKKGWRKPKNEIAHLRKDVHYGQFLQVPKGQRDIFVRKERRSNAGSLIAAIIVLAIIAAVFYFLWTWMSANWGVAVR